jgi:hypothetical protein
MKVSRFKWIPGYYALDNMQGDETLQLAFFPCKGPLPQPEPENLDLHNNSQVFALIASASNLRPEATAALPSCPSAAERRSALDKPENLVLTPYATVAAQVAIRPPQTSVSKEAKFKPVIVTLRLRRG